MTKLIIHILPQNSTICGGIKVHYQLSELESELGWHSIIAFPDAEDSPTWFEHSCVVQSYWQVKELLKNVPDAIVVGWEDPNIVREFPACQHVCYIQGAALVDRGKDFSNIELWYTSRWNQVSLGFPGKVIPLFINPSVFYPIEEIYKKFAGTLSVLIQARKGGYQRWQQVLQYIPSKYRAALTFVIQEDVSEREFAKLLRQSSIFFAHSYPEGFNLPCVEAMASGTIVVGYPGGGGTEYMSNMKNSIFVKDGDAQGVATSLMWLLTNKKNIPDILSGGFETAKKYNREATKQALQEVFQ